MRHSFSLSSLGFFCTAAILSLGCGSADDNASTSNADLQADAVGSRVGTVYTLSNAADGNEVLAYWRSADGSLRPAASYSTGGKGSGTGLGSESALFLNGDASWLFAVNAGSNELSAFAVDGETLRLVDCIPSGGTGPLSVTEHDGIVYVLNGGGSGNIVGFARGASGHLARIGKSTQALSSAAAGPAQIAFDGEGKTLYVTEKATSRVDAFAVNSHGVASAAVSIAAAGETPYGFAITTRDQLVVSDAFGGAAGASAVSSYSRSSGSLDVVSASIANEQSGACWVTLAQNDAVAFVTNTASGTVSSYAVSTDGVVSVLASQAATTGDGSKPEDVAVSRDQKFLYVLESGTGAIGSFALGATGTGELRAATTWSGLPASASGIAAR